MHMRTRSTLLLAPIALALSCAGSPHEELADERPPNIVYVLADDLGWNELGCYGQEKIRTPHVDRMAAEGMRFTQHYSGAPVCAPARCVLLTGLHSGHAFIRDNGEIKPEGQRAIPDGTVTVAEVLKQAGYATGIFGKWGLGGPGSEGEPNRQGFDRWFGYLCQRQAHNFYPRYLWSDGEKQPLEGNDRGQSGAQYSHDLIADQALEFIREHQDEPFFLYVPFTIPHLAIQVPDDSLAEYEGLWEDPPYEGGKGYLPHPAPRAGYAAMVTRMDRDVGRILDLLDELGLDENTIVMFSSDNGPTYDRIGGSDSDFFESAGPFRGLKGRVYEGGLRVPLVVRWPGRVAPGAVSEHLSAFQDVMPTMLDLARAPERPPTDGLSFLPTLLGDGEQAQHEHLYWEFRAYGGQQALRMGDWKAVRKGMKKGNRTLELYDLAADIGEANDVAAQHPELIAEIEARMAASRTESEFFPLSW